MNQRNKGRKDLRKDAKAFEGAKPAKAFEGKGAKSRMDSWILAAKAVKECSVIAAEAIRDVSRLVAESEKIMASAAEARRVNHQVTMDTSLPLHSDIGEASVEARVAATKLASEINLATVRGSAAIVASAVAAVVEATVGNREVTSTLSAICAQELKASLRRKKLMHDATEARLEREVVKAKRGDDDEG